MHKNCAKFTEIRPCHLGAIALPPVGAVGLAGGLQSANYGLSLPPEKMHLNVCIVTGSGRFRTDLRHSPLTSNTLMAMKSPIALRERP